MVATLGSRSVPPRHPLMHCCELASYDSQFDDKHARSDLERYLKDGPEDTTRALLDAIRAEAIEGATLLDVGGGIGIIHHELLDAGVHSATHVDASAPYIAAPREKPRSAGTRDACASSAAISSPSRRRFRPPTSSRSTG